ncbi:UDP-N-acetylmuramate dehydrogenase [Buchnera aphidicola]|uniref:UDP-N-acetylenolpyruvoylglucosamine reductase n=1 Tax=Buchnera aphidicola str. USDA (Myzus persicae) TaxID=1009856 RepID=W0P0Q1_BUCMP|nr:UDP-N-acetylmuramate dehydrogenase [Buchnera aphidicola]AHG60319.1 Murb [Buchnera aphidicola str. USDA (Myzus persicae)]AHG60897.1 Murb [Buchnera aphidicola str. W106 (Myzus persicae)]AHG61469.1 Murb [Buchnera aphidicola str. G002 (Myzus persicae)]AHG62042.1 Murb [Buchnera aphidicola str. F009 (Myzus persicae)]WAI02995.1 MAG: UDP-N-acetylmuramate dehydrogenase [Buchnera aphidicola (Myzus persicae)]
MYKIKYFSNLSIKDLNTFRVDLTAKKIIFIKNIKSLIYILQICKLYQIPHLILGEGSNVLFLKNYQGIIIVNRIKGIKIVEKSNNWLLHVFSGEKWHDLVKYTLNLGILGLENSALIPGCIGSAAIQNIGAYGLEFKDVCHYVDVMSFKNNSIIRMNKNSCKFSYRNSIFKNQYYSECVVIAVGIKLSKKWQPLIFSELENHMKPKFISAHQIFNIVSKIRTKNLPNLKKIGNAGSFFKNPIIKKKHAEKLICLYNIPYYPQSDGLIKISGGWLIEHCNLKNIQIGDAAIYQKKKLILINKKKATPQEILQLAQIIYRHVLKKFNIHLEPEVDFIGSIKKIKTSDLFTLKNKKIIY